VAKAWFGLVERDAGPTRRIREDSTAQLDWRWPIAVIHNATCRRLMRWRILAPRIPTWARDAVTPSFVEAVAYLLMPQLALAR